MNNYILHNGELYHWGVLGMKWGRRKGATPSSDNTPNNKTSNNKEEEPVKSKEPIDPVIGKKHVKNVVGSVAILAASNCVASVLKSKGKKNAAKIVRKYGTLTSGLTFASGLFNIGFNEAMKGKNENVRNK